MRDEREIGKQRMLWEDSLDTARAYVTNAPIYTADEIARLYDERAGIEPVFADLKGHWTLGACARDFDATEAWVLLKLIAQNTLTLYAQTRCAPIAPSPGGRRRACARFSCTSLGASYAPRAS